MAHFLKKSFSISNEPNNLLRLLNLWTCQFKILFFSIRINKFQLLRPPPRYAIKNILLRICSHHSIDEVSQRRSRKLQNCVSFPNGLSYLKIRKCRREKERDKDVVFCFDLTMKKCCNKIIYCDLKTHQTCALKISVAIFNCVSDSSLNI